MRRASGVLLLISLISATAALVTYVLIASTIGINRITDTLAWSGSIPIFVGSAIAASLQYSLPPLLAQQQAYEANGEDCLHTGLVMGTAMLAAGAICVVGAILMVTALRTVLSTHDGLVADIALRLNLLYWLIAFSIPCNALLFACHVTRGSHYIANLSGVLPHITTAFSTVFLATAEAPEWIVSGTLFGQSLSLLLMGSTLRGRGGHFRLGVMSRLQIRQSSKAAGYSVLSVLTFNCHQPVEALLAARMETGALALLAFAHRIWVAIGTIVVSGPSSLSAEHLSKAATSKDWAAYAALFRRFLLTAWVLAISTLLIAIPELSVSLVFERGRFDLSARRALSEVLVWFLVGMPLMLGNVLIYRGLFALNLRRAAAALGAAMAVGYLLGAASMAPPLSAVDFGRAFVLSAALAFVGGLCWLEKQVAVGFLRSSLVDFAKVLSCGALLWVTAYTLSRAIGTDDVLSRDALAKVVAVAMVAIPSVCLYAVSIAMCFPSSRARIFSATLNAMSKA
jgi:peptidoglycan biosynthesis protein MviN/MurJ (putative lipid II flippase)